MDSPKPVVTVVIPCYNYGKYVEAAIDSCLASTYQDIEIIVVNDGSTDPLTVDVLKHLNKPKTKIIHQENKGLPAARNRGIEEGTGIYILPLDADDKVDPAYIERAVQVLETKPEVGFVSCWIRYFGDKDLKKELPPFNLYTLLFRNIVCVCSLFRREAWIQAGGYKDNMREGYEDWDFWITLAELGWLGYTIPKILFYYRKHGKTMIYYAQKKHDKLVKQMKANHPKLYDPKNLEKLKHKWEEKK